MSKAMFTRTARFAHYCKSSACYIISISFINTAAVAIFVFITMPAAHAAGVAGRHIIDIGCQGNYCFATFDGAPSDGVTNSTCSSPSNEVRYDASTVAGKLAYAAFLSALTSGKVVNIYIDHCVDSSAWGGIYMTVTYFHVSS